jgi:dihydroorotate dehydrogenase
MLFSFLKPLLFSLSAEKAHELTLSIAHLSPVLGKLTGKSCSDRLSLKVGHSRWLSPIGLAAGLDKNAEALAFFAQQGFGALECGTVTLKPQDGNPKPRLFRYPQELSLRNSMGFPNEGLLKIRPRLKAFEHDIPIGVNIGKNKDSTPEESIDELGTLLVSLEDDADYFVINVSSPNTPGLRALQEKAYLSELFSELKSFSQKDLYLKIAPDLEDKKVIELAELAADFKLTGLIATNTTMMPDRGPGGISGNLLKEKARKIHQLILNQQIPIELIGVGGISSFQDIKNFWEDGGRAVQVYTAYIYQGPELLKSINKEIVHFLDQNQLSNLEDFFKLDLKNRKQLLH